MLLSSLELAPTRDIVLYKCGLAKD